MSSKRDANRSPLSALVVDVNIGDGEVGGRRVRRPAELRSAADSRLTGSSLDAGCTRGLSSSSSEAAIQSGPHDDDDSALGSVYRPASK